MKKIIIGIISFIVILTGIFLVIFFIETSSVSNDSTKVEFTVTKGSTYISIAKSLKDNNLIKSELFYKLYLKMAKPSSLEAGIYNLNKTMSVSDIIKTLEKGNNYNPDVVTFTIPEGKHMEDVAEIIASVTAHTKEEILKSLSDYNFINTLISKYWFITDDVKKTGIRYPLEGYLFPDTYEILNNSVKIEDIAYMMLDKMNEVLTPYKDKIEKSKYSVHEILTLASIVENEAILDSDRKTIASVFYNRLASGMKLQSCATIGYAIGTWKLTYSASDLASNSPYNTYLYAGLPIGPGNMPGLKSIDAAINPETTDYYYFLANVCDKTSTVTYFSKTYEEHLEKKAKYLTCF